MPKAKPKSRKQAMALLEAVDNQDEEKARKLIARHCDVTARKSDPLSYDSALDIACWRDNATLIRLLIDAGVNVNDVDKNGVSALSKVSLSGRLQAVKILLGAGADTNLASIKGNATALHSAASKGHMEILHLLLDHGASTSVRTKGGWTPFAYACYAGQEAAATVLLELSTFGEDVTSCDSAGLTALHHAAASCMLPVLKELLIRGADPSYRCNKGRTPKEYAEQAWKDAHVSHPSNSADVNRKNQIVKALEAETRWRQRRLILLLRQRLKEAPASQPKKKLKSEPTADPGLQGIVYWLGSIDQSEVVLQVLRFL